MTTAIELIKVSRWYGPVIGLNDVTLTVGPGVTGLLGPNGAGKSTLIRLVTGQVRPNLGEVRVLGRPIFGNPAVLARVGCCPDIERFNEDWTGFQFVHAAALLNGFSRGDARRRAHELLELVGLTAAAGRPIGSYSKGMRQRAKFAQALVNDPEVLVLDEPLTGLDPVGRKQMIDLVRTRGDRGCIVLVSSHVLHEVEAMTDSVVLMHHGRILAEGRVHEIRSMLKGYPLNVTLKAADDQALARALIGRVQLDGLRFDAAGLTVETREPDALFRTVEAMVLDEGLPLERLYAQDDSLEAVFDYLVK